MNLQGRDYHLYNMCAVFSVGVYQRFYPIPGPSWKEFKSEAPIREKISLLLFFICLNCSNLKCRSHLRLIDGFARSSESSRAPLWSPVYFQNADALTLWNLLPAWTWGQWTLVLGEWCHQLSVGIVQHPAKNSFLFGFLLLIGSVWIIQSTEDMLLFYSLRPALQKVLVCKLVSAIHSCKYAYRKKVWLTAHCIVTCTSIS